EIPVVALVRNFNLERQHDVLLSAMVGKLLSILLGCAGDKYDLNHLSKKNRLMQLRRIMTMTL
ncbi:MAG TPA: hypothetical protein PKM58_12660, partial [Pyrinomonadaceae bacterium]|nr:hypothetical protein [Pyrinomonadaceae bacterium]